jgi:hypothetical protein
MIPVFLRILIDGIVMVLTPLNFYLNEFGKLLAWK